jgi:hypothetical protein
MIFAIMPKISIDTTEKRWIAALSIMGGLIVGIGAGLVVFILMSPTGKQQLFELLLNGTRAALTAILTTIFTYYFIQRYLRKRELESNIFVAQNLADVRYFLRSMGSIYHEKYIEQPADSSRSAAKLLLELHEKIEQTESHHAPIIDYPLDEVLFEIRGITSVYQAAQEKFRDLSETLTSIRESLAGCSPKFAATLPALLKACDAAVFSASKDVSYADRALKEICYVRDLDMLDKLDNDEIRDIFERICGGVVMLYHTHRTIFQYVDDERFEQVISQWSKKERAAYDEMNEIYEQDLADG